MKSPLKICVYFLEVGLYSDTLFSEDKGHGLFFPCKLDSRLEETSVILTIQMILPSLCQNK